LISAVTQFKEFYQDPELAPVVPYMVFNGQSMITPHTTLADIHKEQPEWAIDDMASGLENLKAIVEKGHKLVYQVYSEEEIQKDRSKANVHLIWCPAEGADPKQPYILALSGGGYGMVTNLSEAFPAAAQWNALGTSVFCLCYRCGLPELFPKPLEDINAALRFIRRHAPQFGIDTLDYYIAGFSAGGHLAASWALEEIGYGEYRGPKPLVCMLAYPMTDLWDTLSVMAEPGQTFLKKTLFGETPDEADVEKCNVPKQMTEDYPPFYIVHADKDPVVPNWNASRMEDAAKENGVRHEIEIISGDMHGFGAGSETDAAGWTARALAFAAQLEL